MHATDKILKLLLLYLIKASFLIYVQCEDYENFESLTMKLCCVKWKYYNMETHQCERLPEQRIITWSKMLRLANNSLATIDIQNDFKLQIRGPCRKPLGVEDLRYDYLKLEHIAGDYCFTHHRPNRLGQYDLSPLHMRCIKDGIHLRNKKVYLQLVPYFLSAILLELFTLLMIFIYILFNDKQKGIQSLLFICYAISILMAEILLMPIVYDYFYPFLKDFEYVILESVSLCFGTSAILWTIVICFEMRRTFKQTFKDYDFKKDEKRFHWYSLYGWGFSLILAVTTWIFAFYQLYDAFLMPFLIIHLILFLTIACDIFRLRLISMSKTPDAKEFLWKSVRIILRLAAMMSLSQMVYYKAFLAHLLQTNSTMSAMLVMNAISILDAVIIFALFASRRDFRDIVISRLRSNFSDFKGSRNFLDEEEM
ncbi:uncharacterized protein LOC106089832 [Stomoxys calcitrans]|uniref:uncharacterized protein LOC106089832 n=1 Tax=Stomoxys calcitrans TaxID=35570 RepID=UPI0027E3A5E9|nr:uncharacterized protein LOC106089832 [Stomoxys calcitrans]